MATGFHYNGTCEVKVGTGGAGALELLGHTINGVDRDPQIIEYPVYTDAGGGEGGVPATFQRIGQIDVVGADIIVYDEMVLAKLRKHPELTTEGVMGLAGFFMNPGDLSLYRLLLTSPVEGRPFNYISARLMRQPVRLATRATVYRLQWGAIPFLGVSNSMNGIVLYNAVTT